MMKDEENDPYKIYGVDVLRKTLNSIDEWENTVIKEFEKELK